jgi:hypothetical protein
MEELGYSASLKHLQMSDHHPVEGVDNEHGRADAITAEPETYTIRSRNTGASRPGSTFAPKERGYRKLATFMAEVDDVVIFRRFKKLNMINLLRLQSELAALELSYEAVCNKDDNSSNPEERGFTQSFYELREFGQISPGSQLELLDRINDTLHKYSTSKASLYYEFDYI